MRVRLLLVTLVSIVLLAAAPTGTAVAGAGDGAPGRVQLVIFYGEGCPYCARELAFLSELQERQPLLDVCLLYTSDAADERSSVDLGGRRIIKKKT